MGLVDRAKDFIQKDIKAPDKQYEDTTGAFMLFCLHGVLSLRPAILNQTYRR
jgi:hypothetical protein